MRKLVLLLAAGAGLAAAGHALAQQPSAAPANGQAAARPWVAPGTPGSPIDGTIFHAQVLLDAAGFPSGVIDGKKGMVFAQAVKGFQQSRGLPVTGELDGATRAALLQLSRPSTRMLRLGANDLSGPFTYPFPEEAADQAKLDGLHYRNALEQLAERFHTTPRTIVALNGPDKAIGQGAVLRLPNILPSSRDYAGAVDDKQSRLLNFFNVDASQPRGDFIVVDKSEGVLRVYQGEVPKGEFSTNSNPGPAPKLDDNPGKLVAQFPVTMGSSKYPLPIGRWKVTTYAFEPPFKFQPELLNGTDANDKEELLPPGPNGPVGIAWLDLTKEHYGIHGTNSPETIGRAESSGCIRLANWDVIRLSRIMKPGFTAIFQA
ncbi:lipoprotein-anchoring transpeptidase ErfK/SrfK [Sphingomonas kaistensis]|uniref:Lipoprotein-anchoring transpeptidase ErfK/SrfK n=1 Tax=Sphingomonas kaistensis TaxID=298708 RepID=A0A7X5YAD6_9SPHN|nr:L,D-transpeptidase family protein [Sphingomonas kaistensis]NJC06790.1 lipoprotein-anchoring transpeptidase ErfK/SrfK [Sphingomonas kaistensis]